MGVITIFLLTIKRRLQLSIQCLGPEGPNQRPRRGLHSSYAFSPSSKTGNVASFAKQGPNSIHFRNPPITSVEGDTDRALQPAPGAKAINEARTKMVSIAKKLLADSQANIKAGEKASATKRDLLSLMVQSNMSPDIRENLKLSDADVIARKFFHSIQWTENLLKHAAEIPTFSWQVRNNLS